ncbi:MAG: hypothetical protein AB2L20_11140 [Mangrovibacterium sp.]
MINQISPVVAIVANDGSSVVTFDNWHSNGYGIENSCNCLFLFRSICSYKQFQICDDGIGNTIGYCFQIVICFGVLSESLYKNTTVNDYEIPGHARFLSSPNKGKSDS